MVRLEHLDTPVVTVDLAAVKRNIARVQSYCDEHGLRFRPHIKTHKIPAIAHLQLRAGAVGITCQKLGEAEVMAAAGIDDILISYPLIGEQKLERLCALTHHARLTVAGDSEACVRQLSTALEAAGREVGFLVECDTGLHRAGVQTPDEAARLASLAGDLPALRFTGLLTYPTVPESGPWLRAARQLVEANGQRVEVVSGGGTSTYAKTHEIGEITEVRCGTYVYGDAACVAEVSIPLEDTALRVRATVVSRPTRDRAIVDAGSKTLTNDPNRAGGGGHGIVLEHPAATIYALHEEHGFIDVSDCPGPGPEVGDVVTIVPNHACGCSNLHDSVVVHEAGEVVGVWDVAARGRLR